jgi:hypothetical protein
MVHQVEGALMTKKRGMNNLLSMLSDPNPTVILFAQSSLIVDIEDIKKVSSRLAELGEIPKEDVKALTVALDHFIDGFQRRGSA